MTKKTRIDIAACSDRNFVMPTGVMMQSVCVNNPDVFFGHQVSYSSYSPKRLYCMYKSQTILILSYHSEMLWKTFSLYLRKTPRNIILFEEDKLRKLWAIFSGILEGVLYQWFHR